jgi:hypothetical protein
MERRLDHGMKAAAELEKQDPTDGKYLPRQLTSSKIHPLMHGRQGGYAADTPRYDERNVTPRFRFGLDSQLRTE